MPELSIVVPVLNEAAEIVPCLTALEPWRRRGHEVIVVDGGSADRTPVLAAGHCDVLLRSPAGRARQMNTGAAVAAGTLLVFLHVDTRLPLAAEPALASIARAGEETWGRFDVTLGGSHPLLRVVESMMNWRSRASGIATGDQAIFVSRRMFEGAGGYDPIDLMEDIALCGRLRKLRRPVCRSERVVTSARRWQTQGVVRTVLRMWWLRLGYFCGVSPARLRERYDSQ